MQPLGLTRAQQNAYIERLFTSHDFQIDVDILTPEEKPIGSAFFVDGQVNVVRGADVNRTCSLTLADPDDRFDLSSAALWASRLVRVRHTIEVPGVGDVTTVPFIGLPTAIATVGYEVSLELQDKTAFAVHGTQPHTVREGMNAVAAIKELLRECTGERRFRMPASKRRLSRDYSVGWSEEASPLRVVRRIASVELDMHFIYTCDGYALVRKKPTKPQLHIPWVTEETSKSVDLTEFSNRVRVIGKRTSKTTGNVTTTSQPVATLQIKAGEALSPGKLGRNGVPGYRNPIQVDDDGYRKTSQVNSRAARELGGVDQLRGDSGIACTPVFHADYLDLLTVETTDGTVEFRYADVSSPLGVSGDMTIGLLKPYSRVPKRTRWTKVRHTKTRKKNAKKGKEND